MKNVSRKDLLKSIRRVVIKVGSGVLTTDKGINTAIINDLAAGISDIRQKKIEVILVSSGAIASGVKKIGFSRKSRSVAEKQALAAAGQCRLMMAYEEAFGRHGSKVAQILLTRDDLNHRRRYLNARNTILTLLSWDVIPVINENDTVAVDEIKFGDNDNLSAMVTNLTESNLLVNLTNIDGLFDSDPRTNKDAKLIEVVEKVDRKISRYASAIPGSLGTGGMASKIRAAKKMALAGVPTIIANGLMPGILKCIFSGEKVGTIFIPREVTLCSRKHWIMFTKSAKGDIVLDAGAENAIVNHGKSLLPSGIKEVRGRFRIGDAIRLINESGKQVAVGMANYDSSDVKRISGRKTSEIESILGFKYDDEVIHRDNLVLADKIE
ncbi:gamma-glutamate kinase [uncultured Desulfobacterium sp.]|uniref:Glutamate 5-kinase n=1 Tax=uncultured Desulfobacterium sp. TaxID=201089 RepID=A0A445N1G6_9BACT|nr:gamma-glutamate kinase [uncultured Desulfobacterium sp.]